MSDVEREIEKDELIGIAVSCFVNPLNPGDV